MDNNLNNMRITNTNSTTELINNPIIIQFGQYAGKIAIAPTKSKLNIKIL